ncbi:hypothetical protein TNCT_611081 [Trichonephila clavata]|uniref:Uncharacterized protein n=1 Tax=Trichonephila clavata TaxID=2740835 RepID=A0A8X6GL77_TRICU|nr:hypothetical protein TNCT_611081 [Trichonephila clavata]
MCVIIEQKTSLLSKQNATKEDYGKIPILCLANGIMRVLAIVGYPFVIAFRDRPLCHICIVRQVQQVFISQSRRLKND